MRAQTFYDWLLREITSSRMALVSIYERRDLLLYKEAPRLRRQYMELIGEAETPVLEAELEVSLLQRKLELIRIAVNRRELIDLEKIDALLEEEREQKVAEVEQDDLTLRELPQLTEEEQRTLQRQYREIIRDFHPALNADVTDTQRSLYEKALKAYKMQDTEAMKVIFDALYSLDDKAKVSVSLKEANEEKDNQKNQREEYREIAALLSTDYLLAKKLYQYFIPLEEDQVLLDTLRTYELRRKEAEDEIEKIRKGFPFNAEATMKDPAKREEYLEDLRIRTRQYAAEKAELEEKITETVKRYAHG